MRLSTKKQMSAMFVPEFVIFNTELPESSSSVSYEVLQDSKVLFPAIDYQQLIDKLLISVVEELERKSGTLTHEEISFIRTKLEK